MKIKLSKKFLKGVGSVMDIYSNKSYSVRSYVPDRTTADRLREDWERVGKTISKVTSYHANGQR